MKTIKLKDHDGWLDYARKYYSEQGYDDVVNIVAVMEQMKAYDVDITIIKQSGDEEWYQTNCDYITPVGLKAKFWLKEVELRFFDIEDTPPKSNTTHIDLEFVKSHISTVNYFTASDGINNGSGSVLHITTEKHDRYTFCVITLKNGMVFHGVNSGGFDPEKFDKTFGEKDAYNKALDKVWEAVACHYNF